jgi:hypothetical protein
MSLLEVLLAGVLFFGSSTASLLIWSRALATLTADAQRAERAESLEAELQSLESRLRDPALLGSSMSCDQRLQRLVQALDGAPPQPGVGRQILQATAPQPLQVRVKAGGMERQRSYDPAAFGGCSLPPPSATTPEQAFPFGSPSPPDQAVAKGGSRGVL